MRKLFLCGALLWPLALSASQPLVQDTIRFAAFGDYGKNTGTKAVAQLVSSQAPDFIITLGDNCYHAKPPLATQVGTPYGSWVAQQRFWPSLGNHEFTNPCGGVSGTASGYFDYFDLPHNERYYDFVKGPVHFFALNSAKEPDGKGPKSTQARWLKGKLAASTSPWQVVYFHHPAYSSGKGGSTKIMQWPFELWGVDAVLSGHDHVYERILRDDNGDGVQLPYFVSGLGGYSISTFAGDVLGSAMKYNAAYGSLFVTATSTVLQFEFRNVNGVVVDTYSVTKSPTQSSTQFEWKVPPQ